MVHYHRTAAAYFVFLPTTNSVGFCKQPEVNFALLIFLYVPCTNTYPFSFLFRPPFSAAATVKRKNDLILYMPATRLLPGCRCDARGVLIEKFRRRRLPTNERAGGVRGRNGKERRVARGWPRAGVWKKKERWNGGGTLFRVRPATRGYGVTIATAAVSALGRGAIKGTRRIPTAAIGLGAAITAGRRRRNSRHRDNVYSYNYTWYCYCHRYTLRYYPGIGRYDASRGAYKV